MEQLDNKFWILKDLNLKFKNFTRYCMFTMILRSLNNYTMNKDILILEWILDQSKFSILIRFHDYSQNIKVENPEQSVVYLTILWLECGCTFRGLKCSITCFMTSVPWMLRSSSSRDRFLSYKEDPKVPRTLEPIHEIYPSKRARFDRRKISTCNSYKYYSIDR